MSWTDHSISPRGVIVFWCSYSLLHASLSLVFKTGLDLDDAQAAEMMQRSFSWAYQARNPPLYEWLLYLLGKILGDGERSLLALRYLLIAGIGISAFFSVKRITGSPLAGAFLSYGLLFAAWFAWTYHTWATHTLILTIAIFWFMAAWTEWLEKRSAASIAFLAFVTTIGMLSKWSFVLPLTFAFVVTLADKRWRSALWDWRILFVPLMAGLALTPTLLWLSEHSASVPEMAVETLRGEAKPWAVRSVEALWLFPRAWLNFFLSLGPIVFLYFLRYRNGERRWTPSSASVPHLRLAAVIFAVSWVGVVLTGSANLAERYIYPVALPALVAGAVWVAGTGWLERNWRVFIRGALIAAAIVLVLRVNAFSSGGYPEKKKNKHLIPYPALCAELDRRSLGEAYFVTVDTPLAGNILTCLPAANASSLDTRRIFRRNDFPADGECVLIWHWGFWTEEGNRPDAEIPGEFSEYLPAGAALERVDVQWPPTILGHRRTSTWYFARPPRGGELGRMVFNYPDRTGGNKKER